MYELLRNRALKSDPPLGFEPPLMPDSLVAYMKRTDPAAHPEAFDGKSLLILSGGTDKLVNYTDGVRYQVHRRPIAHTIAIGERSTRQSFTDSRPV